jgi:hypothetical protein
MPPKLPGSWSGTPHRLQRLPDEQRV